MRILTQGPYSVRYNSLFTDPRFSLQSPSSAGDLLRSRARLALAHADVFQKNEKKKENNVCVQATAVKEVDCTSMAALTPYALELFLRQHSDF